MERRRLLSIAERRAQLGVNINAATQKLQSIDAALQKASRLSRAQGVLAEFSYRQESELAEMNQDLQNGIYTLPDGAKVTVGNEKAIQVLEELHTDPEHAISSSTLAQKLFRLDLERRIFDMPAARTRTAGVVSTINNKIFPRAEVEWEIRNASPDFVIVNGKRQRPEATYYLARKERVIINDNVAAVENEAVVEEKPEVRPTSPPAAVMSPAERQALTIRRETKAVLTTMVGTLPDAVIEDVAGFFRGNVDELRQELVRVAQVVVDVRDGKITVPTPVEFLGIGADDRAQLAERTLHGIVARAIIPTGEYRERDAGLKIKLGRELNRLKFLLGQRDGKKMVLDALERLPHLERLLIERSMSTSLKFDLDFPDLYECDEEQFADYIVFSSRFDVRGTFKETDADSRRQKFDEQIEKLGVLLDAFEDRTAGLQRDFSGRRVIDAIAQREDAADIFNRMIYTARVGDYLDLLEDFFQTGDAEDFARRCRKLRGAEGLD